jgi:hypothetical protein
MRRYQCFLPWQRNHGRDHGCNRLSALGPDRQATTDGSENQVSTPSHYARGCFVSLCLGLGAILNAGTSQSSAHLVMI